MIISHPVEGDIRERTIWCIFPLKFLNTTYWFERVRVKEEYCYYINNLYYWEIVAVTPLANKK